VRPEVHTGLVRPYGQYCPVARTAEIFAERWTPIIVRNLLTGSHTFGQLREGAPGIPKALLADRLTTLARAGIIERRVDRQTKAVTYQMTQAGLELKPLIDAMGFWGMRWLEVEPHHIDPAYVLWATARLVDTQLLPDHTITVRFDLEDSPNEHYWLLLHRPHAEICTHYPGHAEDLLVHCETDALARLHLRERTYTQLVRAGRIRVDGPPRLARALHTWIKSSPYASAGERRMPIET
jgi:DNA-binding HxlR family transcriptional regulator